LRGKGRIEKRVGLVEQVGPQQHNLVTKTAWLPGLWVGRVADVEQLYTVKL
jgi:hypothetical protein